MKFEWNVTFAKKHFVRAVKINVISHGTLIWRLSPSKCRYLNGYWVKNSSSSLDGELSYWWLLCSTNCAARNTLIIIHKFNFFKIICNFCDMGLLLRTSFYVSLWSMCNWLWLLTMVWNQFVLFCAIFGNVRTQLHLNLILTEPCNVFLRLCLKNDFHFVAFL